MDENIYGKIQLIKNELDDVFIKILEENHLGDCVRWNYVELCKLASIVETRHTNVLDYSLSSRDKRHLHVFLSVNRDRKEIGYISTWGEYVESINIDGGINANFTKIIEHNIKKSISEKEGKHFTIWFKNEFDHKQLILKERRDK